MAIKLPPRDEAQPYVKPQDPKTNKNTYTVLYITDRNVLKTYKALEYDGGNLGLYNRVSIPEIHFIIDVYDEDRVSVPDRYLKATPMTELEYLSRLHKNTLLEYLEKTDYRRQDVEYRFHITKE